MYSLRYEQAYANAALCYIYSLSPESFDYFEIGRSSGLSYLNNLPVY